MITKFKYNSDAKGVVTRTPVYSFTAIESLEDRIVGIDNTNVVSSIVAATLKGETERPLIEAEDTWFKVQTTIQDMNSEKAILEKQLATGDKNGNPLTSEAQKVIAARIADLTEGTVVVKKQFYNHYTRETMTVDEVHQTAYTVALENRKDLEIKKPFLSGLRGITTAPARPVLTLDSTKEQEIKKILVRQKIVIAVGDSQDLIADLSNALSAIIKQVSGHTITASEQASIDKYVGRQATIASILASDYTK